MIVVLSGLAAGAAHVVTGPDHLAAIAPLAAHSPARGLRIGAAWGLGHGIGVLIAAGIAQLLRTLVSLDELAQWSERMVGVVLIALGLWAFRRASRLVVHSHGHSHGGRRAHSMVLRPDPMRARIRGGSPGLPSAPLGAPPSVQTGTHEPERWGQLHHEHLHLHTRAPDAPGAHARHTHASFWIGTLHGSAGAGHLLGVLPSLALPTHEAVVYLAAYFVAAIASMALVGLMVGRLTEVAGERHLRTALMVTSMTAIAVGVWWLVASFGAPSA